MRIFFCQQYFVNFILLRSFRYTSFHFVLFHFVSFCFVLFCCVSFRFRFLLYRDPLVCTCLQYKSFENAKKEKLLVMSNFFFSDSVFYLLENFLLFSSIQNSRLHTLSVWKSLKFVIWEIAKPHSVFYMLLIGINLKSVLKQCHIWLPSSPYQKK